MVLIFVRCSPSIEHVVSLYDVTKVLNKIFNIKVGKITGIYELLKSKLYKINN